MSNRIFIIGKTRQIAEEWYKKHFIYTPLQPYTIGIEDVIIGDKLHGARNQTIILVDLEHLYEQSYRLRDNVAIKVNA